jgi:hypothetical protein
MKLLDLLHSRGLHPVHVSAAKGGEYASPCPACGGKDRFHSFPEQDGGPACVEAGALGTFWCRGCGKAGDMLEYLVQFDGLDFAAACRELKVPQRARKLGLPTPKSTKAPVFVPRELTPPSDAWRERAAKLVDKAHARLLRAPTPLRWLAARGLDIDAVCKYRLGYLEGEGDKLGIIRPRKVWGLPNEVTKDQAGNPKTKTTFFIPRGIVIPAYGPEGMAAAPIRLRVRRSDADTKVFGDKYMVVKGSCMAPMLLGAECRAHVVVEAELDAMLVHHLAGDKAGALAVLTNLGKPDAAAYAALTRNLCTLVALDFDKAGADGWLWWKANCPTAKRWPVPAGKDPGDAYALREDLRVWVLTGLPPVLRMPASAKPAPQASAATQAAAPAPAPRVGPSLSGACTTEGEGKRFQPASGTLMALQLLANFMARTGITWLRDADGTPRVEFAQDATPAEREAQADELILLAPDDVHACIKAHPDDLVTATNICAPFATNPNTRANTRGGSYARS